MTTGKAQPAFTHPVDTPGPQQTSITAHTVLSVVVSMSTVEMDTLAGILSHADDYSLSPAERIVRDGFLNALERVR